MSPLEQAALAEYAITGLTLRIERATHDWETPLTPEEARHIALSLVSMVMPHELINVVPSKLHA